MDKGLNIFFPHSYFVVTPEVVRHCYRTIALLSVRKCCQVMWLIWSSPRYKFSQRTLLHRSRFPKSSLTHAPTRRVIYCQREDARRAVFAHDLHTLITSTQSLTKFSNQQLPRSWRISTGNHRNLKPVHWLGRQWRRWSLKLPFQVTHQGG